MLWQQAVAALEFNYHQPPSGAKSFSIYYVGQLWKLAQLANTTEPRSACSALSAWKAVQRTLARQEEVTEGNDNDDRIVVSWEEEVGKWASSGIPKFREENAFNQTKAVLGSIVSRLEGQCSDSETVSPPQEGEWQLTSAQRGNISANWWSEVQTSRNESVEVEWSGEYVHIPAWEKDPAELPYKLTADTYEASAMLVGLQPEYFNASGPGSIQPMDKSMKLPADIEQLVGHLRSLSVPVCALKGKRASGGQEWIRDWGWVFKGNADEQVPILYETKEESWTIQNTTFTAQKHLEGFQGGNLFGTGTGVCLSTGHVISQMWKSCRHKLATQATRPLDDSGCRQMVVKGMKELGCHTWVFTDFPQREATHHIDVFVGQVDATAFMVGARDVRDDPLNSVILHHARKLLEKMGERFGFKVEEIPMPPVVSLPKDADHTEMERNYLRRHACWLLADGAERKCTFQPGDCCSYRKRFVKTRHTDIRWRWRSYANILPIHFNGTRSVIVPSFKRHGEDSEIAKRIAADEDKVGQVLQKHFDKVDWISQEDRVVREGSIHCMTRAVPKNVETQFC